MPSNQIDSLPSAEKHIAKMMEQFSRMHGDRIRAEKVMDAIDWNEFNMKEIRDARDSLTHRGLIKEEGDFIYRLWH